MIKVKRLDSKAILPFKAKEGDSGYDICSIERKVLSVASTVKVRTGLSFEAPEGYELQVRPRSGLSSKGIIVTLGTVDNGYRGEVQVIVTNSGYDKYIINEGDKIAQIVPVAIPQFEIVEVDELSETNRGSNGFGSTGLNTKTEQVDYRNALIVSPSYYKQLQEFGMIPKEKDDKDNIDLKNIDGEGKCLFEYLMKETDIQELYDKGLYVDNSGIDSRVPKVVSDGSN